MTPARKYGFETVFSAEGEILRDGHGLRAIYTAKEVEAIRGEAFAAGQDSEMAKAQRAGADMARILAKQAQLLLAQIGGEIQTLRAEATQFALAAGRAIAGAALDSYGEARALQIVQEALEELRLQPRLLVRVPQALHPILEPLLQGIAAEQGLGDALIIRPDAGAQPGDVSLEWPQGRISVSRADLLARLEAMAAEVIAETGNGP